MNGIDEEKVVDFIGYVYGIIVDGDTKWSKCITAVIRNYEFRRQGSTKKTRESVDSLAFLCL
ncbi:hypothetical protein I858_003570 [Planococcus versutus]|uniref:Uncharacterized protein n=1 Tax=Planococcus versutus TaxID=1302659 RepID=A0A1B1RYV3_9BACL|nr:hypothetical protein I858_003570 [Planococcus versutus]